MSAPPQPPQPQKQQSPPNNAFDPFCKPNVNPQAQALKAKNAAQAQALKAKNPIAAQHTAPDQGQGAVAAPAQPAPAGQQAAAAAAPQAQGLAAAPTKWFEGLPPITAKNQGQGQGAPGGGGAKRRTKKPTGKCHMTRTDKKVQTPKGDRVVFVGPRGGEYIMRKGSPVSAAKYAKKK